MTEKFLQLYSKGSLFSFLEREKPETVYVSFMADSENFQVENIKTKTVTRVRIRVSFEYKDRFVVAVINEYADKLLSGASLDEFVVDCLSSLVKEIKGCSPSSKVAPGAVVSVISTSTDNMHDWNSALELFRLKVEEKLIKKETYEKLLSIFTN